MRISWVLAEMRCGHYSWQHPPVNPELPRPSCRACKGNDPDEQTLNEQVMRFFGPYVGGTGRP